MFPEEVTQAWGKPDRVDAAVSSYGKRETWYYGAGRSLEFDGDPILALTAIQTSR
jgi:hypothetical protein